MKKIILFDFDGVIADTFDFCYTLHKMSYPENSVEDYRNKFAGNINEALHSVEAKPEEVNKSNRDFFSLYKPQLMKLEVINNMAQVISNLAADYDLFIISSTDTNVIKEFLEREKLLHYFKQVLGNDVHFSKVKKIQMLYENYNADSANYLFVTDTLGDIREAEKCNIKSIAVAWGYHPVTTLEKGNPIAIVQTPKELVEAIRTSFKI
ncbi:MAG: HAD family hydrolase [Candidatus Doudnabacteria bacterium]|nr:HAD family hydrolase [Candidatus Doudnabacteria bacterium]